MDILRKGMTASMRWMMVLIVLLVTAVILVSLTQGQSSNVVSFANNSTTGFP